MQVMVPMNFNEFIDDLKQQVNNNIIPMKRIDDAVRRILRVKFIMGLFENPLADLTLVNQLGNQVCVHDPRYFLVKTAVLFSLLTRFLILSSRSTGT